LKLDLAAALEIFKQPKYGGRRTASTPLREFGEDPASGLAVVAKTGQFGDYVTDGVINATVPKEEALDEMAARPRLRAARNPSRKIRASNPARHPRPRARAAPPKSDADVYHLSRASTGSASRPKSSSWLLWLSERGPRGRRDF
jgi:topoisomerase IA-like protein